ncbi:hypothetical protein AB0A95_18655 [Micromonospora sp. NPDC049230]|uniref:hypothetical protein n=1 Tax=Micromonospora sp. NPDC049230 TaxID=3155502 RepID=UPI003409EE62
MAGPAAVPAEAGPVDTDARTTALVQRLRQLLPNDYLARKQAAGLQSKTPVASIIDPGDYECGETSFDGWVASLLTGWSPAQKEGLRTILQYDVPLLDAAYYAEPERKRSFGLHGEYTSELRRTFTELRGFWDIRSKGIELVPMHGSTLLDPARSARALQAGYGVSAEIAAEAAAALKELADQDVYDHGNFPLFTTNAVSLVPGEGEVPPPGAQLSKRIVVGDGLLTGARAIGFGDVAPATLLAHEFGHQIQEADGLGAVPANTPEATRRWELMADGLGGYFLGHNRGKNLSWKRIRDAVKFTAASGDCSFDVVGHHGTPNQRGHAAEWGAKLAQKATWPHQRVLPSKRVTELFDRKLPALVAPDAPDTVSLTAAEISAAA